MTYTVQWHPNARKFVAKLPVDVAGRIVAKMRQISENPFRYLEHLEGASVYKLRVGDYRLLVDADQSRHILFVRIVDHRSRVYDR